MTEKMLKLVRKLHSENIKINSERKEEKQTFLVICLKANDFSVSMDEERIQAITDGLFTISIYQAGHMFEHGSLPWKLG